IIEDTGSAVVYDGTIAGETVVSAGGVLIADSDVLLSGSIIDAGKVSGGTVTSGTFLYVSSGGESIGVILASSGHEIILDSGTALGSGPTNLLN
ncbi:hypothetical protein, partial [Acetobacter cibinongensis]|uniref:hypothetical protein n=1 Tax=Acetobacter cibinongensis TaxID=146475 RepID=UPI0013FD4EB4